jgi:hypothetical protein
MSRVGGGGRSTAFLFLILFDLLLVVFMRMVCGVTVDLAF